MHRILAGMLFSVLSSAPASALDAGDRMQAWAEATPADKDDLLHTLDAANGGAASRNSVRSCLDDTSKLKGHSDLPISEVFKACYEQAERDNI